MKNIIWIIVIAATPMLIESCLCRGAKKITIALDKKDTIQATVISQIATPEALDSIKPLYSVYQKIKNQRLQYKTANLKIKVEFNDGKKDVPPFNGFVHIKHGEKIWISANAALGVEAMRAVITPDSIFIVNKLDKYIIKRSLSYVQEITSLPFDFNSLEDAIIGNLVYPADSIKAFKYNQNDLTLFAADRFFKQLLTIDTNLLQIKYHKLDDLDITRSRTCYFQYKDYQQENGQWISMDRGIVVTDKGSVSIGFTIKSIKFNEELNFNIKFPKNFKKK
jgi:hypothetical protein